MVNFRQFIESQGFELYHGSKSEQINGPLRTNEKDSGWFGSGFYLTAYPEYAVKWGKYIYKMLVPNGKFAEIHSDENYKKINFIGDAQKANQEAGGAAGWIDNEFAWSQKFTNILKNLNYIGIRVHIGAYKDLEVLVFDPSHITVLERIN